MHLCSKAVYFSVLSSPSLPGGLSVNIVPFKIELRRYVKPYFLFHYRGDFLCQGYIHKKIDYEILYILKKVCLVTAIPVVRCRFNHALVMLSFAK